MSSLIGRLSNSGTLSGSLSAPRTLEAIVSNPSILSGKLSNATLRGYSAYDIAVMAGFEGTIEEWLASLSAAQLELRNNNGVLEYKYENENNWTILIDLSTVNDYNSLINKPSIDGRVLSGNRDLSEDYLPNENVLTNMDIERIFNLA